MDHFGTLADWALDGESDWTGRGSFLRFVSYGVVWAEEDFWSVCDRLRGIHFHPVLCEIAAGAFGWGAVGWASMFTPYVC